MKGCEPELMVATSRPVESLGSHTSHKLQLARLQQQSTRGDRFWQQLRIILKQSQTCHLMLQLARLGCWLVPLLKDTLQINNKPQKYPSEPMTKSIYTTTCFCLQTAQRSSLSSRLSLTLYMFQSVLIARPQTAIIADIYGIQLLLAKLTGYYIDGFIRLVAALYFWGGVGMMLVVINVRVIGLDYNLIFEMAGKKKGGNKAAEKPIVDTSNAVKKVDSSKELELNRIMSGINEMDLDNENFLDVPAFDQSKAILDNAMEDLTHYLKLFSKGDFQAFPKVKVDSE